MRRVNHDIDIGLAALCQHAKPNQVLSITEIAEVCNCNRSYINLIERTARKKALEIASGLNLIEFLKD